MPQGGGKGPRKGGGRSPARREGKCETANQKKRCVSTLWYKYAAQRASERHGHCPPEEIKKRALVPRSQKNGKAKSHSKVNTSNFNQEKASVLLGAPNSKREVKGNQEGGGGDGRRKGDPSILKKKSHRDGKPIPGLLQGDSGEKRKKKRKERTPGKTRGIRKKGWWEQTPVKTKERLRQKEQNHAQAWSAEYIEGESGQLTDPTKGGPRKDRSKNRRKG